MLRLNRAHKIRIRPTREQTEYLVRYCAACRNAYNFGLERLNAVYDRNEKLHESGEKSEKYPNPRVDLKKQFRSSDRPEWIKSVPGCVIDGAFDDLGKSLSRFWDIQKGKIKARSKRIRKDGRRSGWPRFRSSRGAHRYFGFYLSNEVLRVEDKRISIGSVRTRGNPGWFMIEEQLRFLGKLNSARVTWDGFHWWISIHVEAEFPEPVTPVGKVGVDLGIKYLATTSDGKVFENPKSGRLHDRKIRRLYRRLDRQRRKNNPDNFNEDGTVKTGKLVWVESARMKKTREQIANYAIRAKNIRTNRSHEMTRSIVRENGFVALETLNVSGMLSNHKLARSVSDASFHEITRQIEYKSEETGSVVQKIDTWFPSSKKCSGCGLINQDLKLSDRSWKCSGCGQQNERDQNAAVNILMEGERLYSHERNSG